VEELFRRDGDRIAWRDRRADRRNMNLVRASAEVSGGVPPAPVLAGGALLCIFLEV